MQTHSKTTKTVHFFGHLSQNWKWSEEKYSRPKWFWSKTKEICVQKSRIFLSVTGIAVLRIRVKYEGWLALEIAYVIWSTIRLSESNLPIRLKFWIFIPLELLEFLMFSLLEFLVFVESKFLKIVWYQCTVFSLLEFLVLIYNKFFKLIGRKF